MTPYQEEQLENIRRACEDARSKIGERQIIDSFNHILDLIETMKEDTEGYVNQDYPSGTCDGMARYLDEKSTLAPTTQKMKRKRLSMGGKNYIKW